MLIAPLVAALSSRETVPESASNPNMKNYFIPDATVTVILHEVAFAMYGCETISFSTFAMA